MPSSVLNGRGDRICFAFKKQTQSQPHASQLSPLAEPSVCPWETKITPKLEADDRFHFNS